MATVSSLSSATSPALESTSANSKGPVTPNPTTPGGVGATGDTLKSAAPEKSEQTQSNKAETAKKGLLARVCSPFIAAGSYFTTKVGNFLSWLGSFFKKNEKPQPKDATKDAATSTKDDKKDTAAAKEMEKKAATDEKKDEKPAVDDRNFISRWFWPQTATK